MIKEKHSFNVDDGSEDGIDMEETRYPYYDDNLDMVGYTSELRYDNGKFFAFVDFTADDDTGYVRLCPHCLQFELKHKLGPKIKKKGEKPAPDDEQWLSCYECGRTYPIHETHYESKIKDSVETTDNPFNNESTFLSTETRKQQRRKKGTDRRKWKSKFAKDDDDPEIDALLRIYGEDRVKIVYDSDP